MQVLFLRPKHDDVLAARELMDACGAHEPIDLSLLASSLCHVSRCREGTQMVHCALLVSSAHHKHSREGRSNNGQYLDKGREKGGKQNRSWVGVGTPPALQVEAGWFPIVGDTTGARIS